MTLSPDLHDSLLQATPLRDHLTRTTTLPQRSHPRRRRLQEAPDRLGCIFSWLGTNLMHPDVKQELRTVMRDPF